MAVETLPIPNLPSAAPTDPFARLVQVTAMARESFAQLLLKRFKRNHAAMLSFWILLTLFTLCYLLSFLFVSPETVVVPNPTGRPLAPGRQDIGAYFQLLETDKAFDPTFLSTLGTMQTALADITARAEVGASTPVIPEPVTLTPEGVDPNNAAPQGLPDPAAVAFRDDLLKIQTDLAPYFKLTQPEGTKGWTYIGVLAQLQGDLLPLFEKLDATEKGESDGFPLGTDPAFLQLLREARTSLAPQFQVLSLANGEKLDPNFLRTISKLDHDRKIPFTLALATHPFGTDTLGRDYLSRCLYGGRVSLLVGFVAVGIAVTIGTLLGSAAGFFGGLMDSLISRFTEIMLSFPTFFLIITVQSVLTPNIFNVMAVIGITSWMGVSRLVRGQVLAQKEEEYIQASRASGAGITRIMLRHLIPNSVGPIIVAATLAIPGAILTESALSYFGMGVQPPFPSWGNMISDAREVGITRGLGVWWLMVYPGLFISATVIAFNFLGEGLRDALDPRS